MVTEVNGSEADIKYKTLTEILLCKKSFNIIGARVKRRILEIKPNKMLRNKHFFIAIFAPVFELIASSSETNLVVARFIPELAKVIQSMYIDITSPNIPIPSEPIIFAR